MRWSIRDRIEEKPLETLSEFPYIGPVTVYHLAKNLGFPVAKPDRHLVRIANVVGRASPAELCDELSLATGDPVQLVDLVLWRYASSTPGYEELIRVGIASENGV